MGKETGMKKIEAFLENLTFAKTLLGANQADVYACLKDVSAMYEDVIKDMEQEAEAEAEKLKRTIEEKDRRIEELIRRSAASQARTKPKDTQRTEELKGRLEQARAHEEEYRAAADLLARSLKEQQRDKEEWRLRAERESRLIIARAKEEVSKIVEQAEQRVRMEYRQAQEGLKEAARMRGSMQESLGQIVSDLSSMTEKAEGLRGKLTRFPDIDAQSGASPLFDGEDLA